MAAHRHWRLGGAYSDRSAGRCHAPTLDPLARRFQLRRLRCVRARVVGHEGMEARMRPFHLVWTRGCASSHRSAAPQGFQPGALPLVTEVPDPDWFDMAGG
jgi:hypothetical protein